MSTVNTVNTDVSAKVKVMQAYKNNPKLRAKFLAEMDWHAEQDKIVQATYGDSCKNGDFRGCFVGCAVHSLARIEGKKLNTSNHQLIEEYLAIPVEIAHLADAVFESLPADKAKKFAVKLPRAIKCGADLSMVIPHFLYWTLTDRAKPTQFPQFQEFIDGVVAIYKEWTESGVKPPRGGELDNRADLAYRAYLADLANRADLAYLADLADLAYRAYLAYLAYRAYLADRAYLAYLAYQADLADRTDLADRAYRAAEKLLELLEQAPVPTV